MELGRFLHRLQCCAPQSMSFPVWLGAVAGVCLLQNGGTEMKSQGKGGDQHPRHWFWAAFSSVCHLRGADISSVTHSRVRLSVSQRSAWLIPYEALTRGASGSAPLQEEEPRWSKAPQVLLHHVSRDSWGLWHLRRDWVPKRLLAPVLLVTRAQGSQTGYFLNSFGITQKIRLCKATRIE